MRSDPRVAADPFRAGVGRGAIHGRLRVGGFSPSWDVRALFAVILTLPALAANADELSRVFKRVTGAVVVVHTFGRQLTRQSDTGELESSTAEGLGSGVLVSDDGMIVTAAHVVQVADRVEVEFIDHQRIVADVVGSSSVDDVALLRLTSLPHGIAAARWGNSDAVDVGDPVFVVGAPYGLDHTLTAGRISGRRPRGANPRGMGGSQGELFQTDAAINRGNSGGPLFDQNGSVIGIVSFILTSSGGFEGLGFAVTSKTVQRVLIANHAVWTGISGILLNGDLAEALQLPQAGGYLIQNVARYSPGEAAGLRPGRIPAVVAGQSLLLGGDIILRVDSIEVDGTAAGSRTLIDYLGERAPGAAVTLRILRDGVQQDVVSFVPH